MSPVDDRRHVDETEHRFPAYGPIEAGLGYLLFYVLVSRVTPVVVAAFDETVPGLSPSVVRFGLAAALWFVFAVTAIDQLRRQLAALGVGTYDDNRIGVWSRVTSPALRTSGYLLALIAGSAVAAATFDRAIAGLLSLISVFSTLDGFTVDPLDVVVLVAFFLAYSLAAHSLDRLVIGAIRALVSE
ncbi:hypothetical protein [Halorubrum sp. HHNYT27]|uniref:hypothetical protein n=1 Tax=Halorubrum sp. HHNYT27 TaxID=3402275 RepID=UPI003EBC5096